MTRRSSIAAVFALFALVAACGSGAPSGSSQSPPSMSITGPKSGSTTRAPFWVTVRSSVPLGDPSTGRDHVHIWFDGHSDKYIIGYSNRVKVTGISRGQHQMTVSLRNPNHSAVGVEKTIALKVGPGGPTPSPSKSSNGYGY